MVTRVIKTEADRKFLYRFLATRKLPFTVDVTVGKKRSVEQNRLSFLWYKEISEQLGDQSPEDVRAFCKLTIGVPILRAENEDFREKYDAAVRPLNYVQKLAIMREPLDLPITRLMTVAQERQFLDEIHRRFTEQGVVLTDPSPMTEAA